MLRRPTSSNASAAALQSRTRSPAEQPRTAKARRRHFNGSTSLARSNFELTVPFLVGTRTGKPTGRYNRRKLADQVFRRLLAASLFRTFDALAWFTDRSGSRPTVRIQLPPPGRRLRADFSIGMHKKAVSRLAHSAARARERLEDFDHGPWGQKYPAIAQSWRRNWEQVIPFFAFAPELRKILYTTNAIESLNAQVRKAVRVRGHFPSEEAAAKLIWLVLRNVQARWKNPPITWQAAKTQMAIQFEDRFMLAE